MARSSPPPCLLTGLENLLPSSMEIRHFCSVLGAMLHTARTQQKGGLMTPTVTPLLPNPGWLASILSLHLYHPSPREAQAR